MTVTLYNSQLYLFDTYCEYIWSLAFEIIACEWTRSVAMTSVSLVEQNTFVKRLESSFLRHLFQRVFGYHSYPTPLYRRRNCLWIFGASYKFSDWLIDWLNHSAISKALAVTTRELRLCLRLYKLHVASLQLLTSTSYFVAIDGNITAIERAYVNSGFYCHTSIQAKNVKYYLKSDAKQRSIWCHIMLSEHDSVSSIDFISSWKLLILVHGVNYWMLVANCWCI